MAWTEQMPTGKPGFALNEVYVGSEFHCGFTRQSKTFMGVSLVVSNSLHAIRRGVLT